MVQDIVNATQKHSPPGNVNNALRGGSVCARPTLPPSLFPRPSRKTGFTLIELLVVMAVVGLLLSIAAPRYFGHVERAKENTLRQSLAVMRDAIDKYQGDRAQLPESLDELVTRQYLRAIPKDPYTDSSASWLTEPAPEGGSGIFEVRSGAEGQALDGTPLGEL